MKLITTRFFTITRHSLVATLLCIATFFLLSCDSAYDTELQNAFFPQDNTPPERVTEIEITSGNTWVMLSWKNPTDKDFKGTKITATPPLEEGEVVLDKDVEMHYFDNLINGTQYTFTVKTFDTSNNVSIGRNIAAKPTDDGIETAIGGGTTLVPYLKDKIAYDFGYCTSATTKTIEIIASKAMTGIEDTITCTSKSGPGSYVVNSISPTSVTVGGTITINVTYTPGSNSWDEADLSFGAPDGVTIRLIGSGFKQPKDLGTDGSLKIWLRADMIGKTDILGTDLVQRVPDYSGNNHPAICINSSSLPIYNASGINELPTITFKSERYLKAGGNDNDPIINQAMGTTTFVVYRLTTFSSYRTVFQVKNIEGSSAFPQLKLAYRYYDYNLGYRTTTPDWGFAVLGTGISDYRWTYDSKANKSEEKMDIVTLSKPYTSCLRYDGSKTLLTDQNIDVWVNQTKKSLSYFYSNSTVYTSDTEGKNYNTSNGRCYGAYGKPISDGNGYRHSDLGNEVAPGTVALRSKANNGSNQWVKDRIAGGANGENKGRINDYGYYITPGTSGYLRNHVTSDKFTTGTITSLFLGRDDTQSYYFIGDISEIFMFSRKLSDTEVAEMNTYLKLRYNIGD